MGAVLSGGRGRRLGGSKESVRLAGRPLLSYPVETLRRAGLETVVIAKAGEGDPPVDAPVVREDGPRHPLSGILAALRRAAPRPALVIACDMPFVPAGLLSALASAEAPLVVPAPGGRPQPLCARYDSALLPGLEAAPAGEPLRETLERLDPILWGQSRLATFGDPAEMFFNVNDRAGLRVAERRLRGSAG